MDKNKQESDFRQAVNDLQTVSLETLEALQAAAHNAVAELQGDQRLVEAVKRIPVLSHILTVELVAFKAFAIKYNHKHKR